MKLRVLNWNVRRATCTSPVWKIIFNNNPDIITLQEVIGIPNFITDHYSVYQKFSISKKSTKQIFSTAVLVKNGTINQLTLQSEFDWVNNELEFFNGNLLSCEVNFAGLFPFNVVSVYSPAWPVNKERLKEIDVSVVKLKLNRDVWCTEILWAALKNRNDLKTKNWIVAGDFNSSITFDFLWKGGPHGNQEIIDRMNSIGLTECLYTYAGKLIPTFRNPKGNKIIHQLDHMYVSEKMLLSLRNSVAGDSFEIFEKSMSDHLPIISDFFFENYES